MPERRATGGGAAWRARGFTTAFAPGRFDRLCRNHALALSLPCPSSRWFHRAVPADARPQRPSRAAVGLQIKNDGFRFICRRDGDRARVFSRRDNDYTDRVPLVAEALGELRVKSVTLDGEGASCAKGEDRPS